MGTADRQMATTKLISLEPTTRYPFFLIPNWKAADKPVGQLRPVWTAPPSHRTEHSSEVSLRSK